jgi:hypothetical protein
MFLCVKYFTHCISGQIANEFHYILEYKSLYAIRKEFLHSRYCTNPNVITFSEILSTSSAKKLKNQCIFIRKIYDLVCPPSFILIYLYIIYIYVLYMYVYPFPLSIFSSRLHTITFIFVPL